MFAPENWVVKGRLISLTTGALGRTGSMLQIEALIRSVEGRA
jgi:hypothetical protein